MSNNGEPESDPLVTINLSLDSPVVGWHEDGDQIGHGSTIGDAIVAQAAARLVVNLHKDVSKAVLAAFRDQIVSQVATEVARVIAEPVQLTNQWGERSGKTTSVREHIADEVTKQLKEHRGSYHDKPVLQKLIEQEVIGALTSELSGVIKEARDKVVGAVHNKAAELLAKAVKDGLR